MDQTAEESKDAMVAVVFTANDQSIDASLVEAISEGMQRSSLSFVSHGMQSIPEMCFPALTWFEGRVCQVWLEDPEQPVSLFLDWDPRSQVVSTYGVTSPEELQEVFPSELGGVRFSFEEDPVGEADTLEQRRWERVELERLKIAFTWQFVYMVVQADGEFVEAERTFMQRLFPSSVLEATHLLDEQGQFIEPDFTNLKTRALAVLPDALSEEERVDLLKMLADAAWADDKLVPEEEAVFGLAAEILQVPVDLCRSFFRR